MTNVIWQMETERRGHLKGYLFAAAAAVLWGFSGVITKYLLRRQMRPDELLVFRTLLASAILMVWLGLKSPDHKNRRREQCAEDQQFVRAHIAPEQILRYDAREPPQHGGRGRKQVALQMTSSFSFHLPYYICHLSLPDCAANGNDN